MDIYIALNLHVQTINLMKKFLELAFKITILLCVVSVMINVISAYHLLSDVKFSPVYKKLLVINMRIILVSIAVFIIGSLVSSVQVKAPVKRVGFSRRLADRI